LNLFSGQEVEPRKQLEIPLHPVAVPLREDGGEEEVVHSSVTILMV